MKEQFNTFRNNLNDMHARVLRGFNSHGVPKGVKNMKLKEVAGLVKSFAGEHAPTILAVIGAVGVVTTAVLAVNAGMKAQEILKDEPEDLPKAEALAKTWQCYVPVAVSAAASITAIIASERVSKSRLVALAGAYALSTDNLRKYQDKVKELMGEKNAQKVTDAVNADEVKRINTTQLQGIPRRGTMLCMDSITGQLFYSNVDNIYKAVSTMNERLVDQTWVPLSDLLWELGLRSSRMGDMLGWDVSKGSIKVEFTSSLTDDNVPCLVINYKDPPTEIRW